MTDHGWLPFRRAFFMLVVAACAGSLLAQIVRGILHLFGRVSGIYG